MRTEKGSKKNLLLIGGHQMQDSPEKNTGLKRQTDR